MDPDEFVDVVNENNEVIGRELKSVCHEKGILHRGAIIFVFKDESRREVLLQKRSLNKSLSPGLWGISGGHVDSGESYEVAAKRELSEECFLDIDMPNLQFDLLLTDMGGPRCVAIRKLYGVVCSGPFSCNREESDELRFFSFDFLEKDLLENPDKYTIVTRRLIDSYLEKEKKIIK